MSFSRFAGYDNSSSIHKIQKNRTPTIMSGVTTTKAIRNPIVPAMTLLLFEADPDSGGGALDDCVSSMLGTAVYRNTSSSVISVVLL